jgi:hypothetical protein
MEKVKSFIAQDNAEGLTLYFHDIIVDHKNKVTPDHIDPIIHYLMSDFSYMVEYADEIKAKNILKALFNDDTFLINWSISHIRHALAGKEVSLKAYRKYCDDLFFNGFIPDTNYGPTLDELKSFAHKTKQLHSITKRSKLAKYLRSIDRSRYVDTDMFDYIDILKTEIKYLANVTETNIVFEDADLKCKVIHFPSYTVMNLSNFDVSNASNKLFNYIYELLKHGKVVPLNDTEYSTYSKLYPNYMKRHGMKELNHD